MAKSPATTVPRLRCALGSQRRCHWSSAWANCVRDVVQRAGTTSEWLVWRMLGLWRSLFDCYAYFCVLPDPQILARSAVTTVEASTRQKARQKHRPGTSASSVTIFCVDAVAVDAVAAHVSSPADAGKDTWTWICRMRRQQTECDHS